MVTKLKYQSWVAGTSFKIGGAYLSAKVDRVIRMLRPFDESGVLYFYTKPGKGRVSVRIIEEMGSMFVCEFMHEEWLRPIVGNVCQEKIGEYGLPKLFYVKLKDV